MIKLSKTPPIPRLRHPPSLSNDGHQFIRSCGPPNRAMRDIMYSIYSSSAVSYCIIADYVEHGKRWVTSIVFSKESPLPRATNKTKRKHI
jgi:hypothetical protein